MESQNPYNVSTQPNADATTSPATQPYETRTYAVKRIEPISLGMTLGAIYALMGLLFGGLFLFITLLGATVSMEGEAPSAIGVVTGLGGLLLIPIFYGVLGFLFGLIGAVVYNLIARWLGGIRLDLES
ncbi:MAG: hypothetical protein ACR2NZ_09165 [Rubripirellula sp.]